MRRILGFLKDIRQHQLSQRGASNERLAEAGALFDFMDAQLTGVRVDAPNTILRETLVSADFTYAIMEFVNRLAIPGYEKKNFNFEPLIFTDQVTNFLPHNRYQNRGAFDDLEYVGSKGQARPGSIDDATKRVHSAYRFEKQIDIQAASLGSGLVFQNHLDVPAGQGFPETIKQIGQLFHGREAVDIHLRVGNFHV